GIDREKEIAFLDVLTVPEMNPCQLSINFGTDLERRISDCVTGGAHLQREHLLADSRGVYGDYVRRLRGSVHRTCRKQDEADQRPADSHCLEKCVLPPALIISCESHCLFLPGSNRSLG